MRLMQTCTIHAIVQLHFWTGLALLGSSTSVRAEEQKIPPPVVVEFQLISNGNHNGFASLVVSDFSNFQDNIATPTGPLSPYLVQVTDMSAREIKLLKRLDTGDQIFVLHEKTNNSDFYTIVTRSKSVNKRNAIIHSCYPTSLPPFVNIFTSQGCEVKLKHSWNSK